MEKIIILLISCLVATSFLNLYLLSSYDNQYLNLEPSHYFSEKSNYSITLQNGKLIDNVEDILYASRTTDSGSMRPMIGNKNIILLAKVSEDKINVGDIISFTYGDKKILHRIIDIHNESGVLIYTTKGDNNKLKDDIKITYSQINGKVVGVLW